MTRRSRQGSTDSRSWGDRSGPTTGERTDRAVSPVIAVILMVAGTVMLAVVIVPFILSAASSVGDSSPAADFSFAYSENVDKSTVDTFDEDGEEGDGIVTIVFDEGESIDAGQITINSSVSGGNLVDATDEYESGDDLVPGEEITIWANRGDTIRIVWEQADGDGSDTLGQFTIRPGTAFIPPGAPTPDEDCAWVSDELENSDDLIVDGIVVNCDLDQYDIEELTIQNGGAVIGAVEASDDVTLSDGEIWGDVTLPDTSGLELQNSDIIGDIETEGAIELDGDSVVDGYVVADGTVELDTGSEITGAVETGSDINWENGGEVGGGITMTDGATIDEITDVEVGGDIDISDGNGAQLINSTVGEGIEGDGAVELLDDSTVEGSVISADESHVEVVESIVGGHVETGGTFICVDSTINGEDCDDYKKGHLSVTIDDTNEPLEDGETLEVTVTIENTRYDEDTQEITLEIDDTTEDTIQIDNLDGGEEEEITLEWVDADAGDYEANVSSEDDFETQTVTVDEAGEANAVFESLEAQVTLDDHPQHADDFEFVDFTYTLDREDNVTLEVRKDGTVEEARERDEEDSGTDIRVDPDDNNLEVPVELRAKIEDSKCYETTVYDGEDGETYTFDDNDWGSC